MFFNIDADARVSIDGWLAPDNPSATPRIVILVPGQPELTMATNVERPDIRELGLHATGLVGFHVDNHIVPGLAALEDIEIQDADTRIPLFRRFRPDVHLERKVYLFDCAAMPQRRLLQSTSGHFALNYPSAERYSLETIIVLLNNHFATSLFFSGRSNFNRIASFLENGGYLRAALLRDPVEELAERLLFLNLLTRSNASQFIDIYGAGLAPLFDFAAKLDFTDQKALLTAFRQIDDRQREALTSPMVRMFGCSIDEPPTHNNVSLALDHLASLDLVGTRARFSNFRALLEQFLGIDIFEGQAPQTSPSVEDLAAMLARIGIVGDLLDHDIALYGYVEEALASGLRGGDDLIGRDTNAP